MGLLTALLALWWNPFIAAEGIMAGFWLVWTLQAGSDDESGLFVIGSILLLCGLVVGTAIASAVGYGMRPLLRRRRTCRPQPPHPDPGS